MVAFEFVNAIFKSTFIPEIFFETLVFVFWSVIILSGFLTFTIIGLGYGFSS